MLQAKTPVRLSIIGTARRSHYMYGPIVKALPDEVQLVSVWGRSADSARKLGDALGVPWYTDLDTLVRETAPQIGIVAVNYNANGQAGLMAVQAGLHVLLETPIAHDLREADAIIASAGRHEVKIEVSEQFHRRPVEQVKLAMIRAGLLAGYSPRSTISRGMATTGSASCAAISVSTLDPPGSQAPCARSTSRRTGRAWGIAGTHGPRRRSTA